jgi:hypothetical protein
MPRRPSGPSTRAGISERPRVGSVIDQIASSGRALVRLLIQIEARGMTSGLPGVSFEKGSGDLARRS